MDRAANRSPRLSQTHQPQQNRHRPPNVAVFLNACAAFFRDAVDVNNHLFIYSLRPSNTTDPY